MQVALIGGVRGYVHTFEDTSGATCQECGGDVYARRPSMAIWHWAHNPGEHDCNYVGESEWHESWKMQFSDVALVEYSYGNHRADVWMSMRGLTNPGRVLEFQSKPVDMDVLLERQHAWVNVVWVLDGRGLGIASMGDKDGWSAWSWGRVPRMVWAGINDWTGGAQIYVELPGSLMLRVISVEFNSGFGQDSRVTGELETIESFVSRYRYDASVPVDSSGGAYIAPGRTA